MTTASNGVPHPPRPSSHPPRTIRDIRESLPEDQRRHFDADVVAELTTRAKPDPRVLAWFRSTARPNRFQRVITVAEIEADVAAAPDPVRQARYAQALAAVRHEFRDRIAPTVDRERPHRTDRRPGATAYLTIHKTLKAMRHQHRPTARPDRRPRPGQRRDPPPLASWAVEVSQGRVHGGRGGVVLPRHRPTSTGVQ